MLYYKPCKKCTMLHKLTCNNVLFKMLTKELMHIMSIPGGLLDDGSSTCLAKNNLQSAVSYPTEVDDYIYHELSLGRISGLYPPSISPDVHNNRFGVIPKNYQQDKWQLITDLSYPSGSSVNDGIPSQLCSYNIGYYSDTSCTCC